MSNCTIPVLIAFSSLAVWAQPAPQQTPQPSNEAAAPVAAGNTVFVSGTVVDPQGMVVPGAQVEATDPLGRTETSTSTDSQGNYLLELSPENVYTLIARAEAFQAVATGLRSFPNDTANVQLAFGSLASASEVVTVTARIVEPTIDRRDSEIFTKTLFTRDDQIFQTLGAGLNLGQHAGGGKSLEVRRFGFNLDHGGAGGGIRVLRDNIPLNDISGGHAHGYLGAMKGLTPELVEDVNLINGPFNARYGDFSSLGVVTIDTRREMPDGVTARYQYGQFNTRRFFGAYSPVWEDSSALIAYENSYTDGPFQRKLEYLRHNLSGVYTRRLSDRDTLIFRIWGATNDSYAPGQLPLDQIEAGLLDRYGFVDPTEGNAEGSGTLAAYWNRDNEDGSTWRVDGMVNRQLFDLFSNFTFFLDDPVNGDAIGQHSSRLQEQANAIWSKPHSFADSYFGTFTGGVNLIANQVALTLYGRQGRVPTDLRTSAHANILNPGVFGQENIVFAGGKLRLDLGLRYDAFHYSTQDRLDDVANVNRSKGFWQPKFGVAYTPVLNLPVTLHANYGRSVTSVGARSLINEPGNSLGSTTDFYQFGTSHNYGRYSLATSFFLIDRSDEFIYVADSGQTELGGPSRSYGYEVKASVQITPWLAWNGSISKVSNSYYVDTDPREYVARAPRFTAYSALTISGFRGWSGSLRMRSINSYILVEDGSTRGPGYTVFDFSMARTVNRWLELNFAVDNVLDKIYYETLGLYESRLMPDGPAVERIHGTPGYGRTVIGGVTIRLFPRG